MKVVEINKYRPSLFKNGRFLREDWTSCSDIGKTINGSPVSIDDYRATEQRYLASIRYFMDAAGLRELNAHNVEHWDVGTAALKASGLDDVLDGGVSPTEGESMTDTRLEAAFMRCLRETAWLEFMKEAVFLIHFGHDLRVLVAIEADPTSAIKATRDAGLFVYDGNTRIDTLDAWRGLTGAS